MMAAVPSDPPLAARPLSPSRIKDLEQCPKLFFFKFVLGCSTPPSLATIKGTLFHSVMEQFFRLDPEERHLEVARSFVRPAWEVATNPLRSLEQVAPGSPEALLRRATGTYAEELESSESKLDRALRQSEDWLTLIDVLAERGDPTAADRLLQETEDVVTTYFTSGIEDPEKLRTYQPHAVELYLRADLDGVVLHGFIDRLDHFVRSDGTERWIITDYKTGRAPSRRFEAERFFQLMAYALLLQRSEGIVADELRLLFVGEASKATGDRRQAVDAAVLERTETKVVRAAEAIQRFGEEGHWPTTESRLCDWCAFKRWCPAKGGDEEAVPRNWLDAPEQMVG
jgi:putative RecB family exonuclease